MIEKITPRKLNTSKDARIQGAIEMYDAYNLSISEFDGDQDSSFAGTPGTISGTQTGDQGVIKPAKGNEKVSNSLLITDGVAMTTGFKRKVIGSVTDEINEVIYCFLTSQEGTEHGVYRLIDDYFDPLITSGHFKFPHNAFVKADLVYTKQGPVIYFTDGVNPPRKVNVNKASEINALSDSSDEFQIVDFISACPKTPMHRPTFSFDSDPQKGTNFRGVEGFQFAYQCIYETGEESAISPYSNVAVPPSYLNQGALKEAPLFSDNKLNVIIPDIVEGVVGFTNNVEKIRLLVRPGGRGPFYEVEEKGYFQDVAEIYGGVKFEFFNDTVVTAIPQEDQDKLDEGVPRIAKTQAVVNDRLVYGNYVEGFDEKEKIAANLSVFYNTRGEEFTDLQISVKNLMLPVGYDSGVNYILNSDLKSSGGTDDGGRPLIHNRRAAYQFDLSSLPSSIASGTELRLRLTVRPDKNFELYDSKNSFHTFKNRGYDASHLDSDDASINATTRKIKDFNGSDSPMPAVVQKNEGVFETGVTWKIVAHDAPNDILQIGPIGNGSTFEVTTGHSPSCPFIIPTTSITFALALSFSERIEGSSNVRTNISNALRNFFKNGDLTDDTNGSYPVDPSISLLVAESESFPNSIIDQGMNDSSGFGVIDSDDPVSETVMTLFQRGNHNAITHTTNLNPIDEINPRGFISMNKARLTTSLDFNEAATDAVNGTENDVGPIFSIGVRDLRGVDGTGNPEYHTMIPYITPDGRYRWYWASQSFMASIGGAGAPIDANQFFGSPTTIQATDPVDFSIPIELEINDNLYFQLFNPFPVSAPTSQSFIAKVNGGSTEVLTTALSTTNFFFDDAVNFSEINSDFKSSQVDFTTQITQSDIRARAACLGYVYSPGNQDGRMLKVVDANGTFGDNNGYQKYSIVDGEVNVKRSKAYGNTENQNFWYGILMSCEYLGKQNNMFPLSRGWDGSGGYPGIFHGRFSYGNSLFSESDGLIDSDLSEPDQAYILNESFPDVEIKSFSFSQVGTGVSIDPQARSFKRNCSHDFGVVFYDERGRAGNVNPIGSVFVDGFEFTPSATGSAFVVAEFSNTQSNIPSWAHHYRIVYGGNSSIDDFVQYSAGGAFVPDASKNNDGLIYVSLNYLQENNLVSYSKAFGAVGPDGDKDLYTFSEGDRLRVISYYNDEDTRIFVDDAKHNFEVVGTVTLGDNDNPLVAENEEVHPAKTGQFVILKDNYLAQGFSFDDVSQSRSVGAGLDTSDIYDNSTNLWNRRCIFEIYSPSKSQSSENRIYHEIGKTYNIIKSAVNGNQRRYQTPIVIITEGDVFFRKQAVNLNRFVQGEFKGLIGNGNGSSEESIEPNFQSYFLESRTFTDNFPGTDVKPFGKPRIVSRNKSQVSRPSSIKFSDKSSSEANVVRYTSFNNSKLPFKDMQNSDGPIYSLENFNDSLFCIQQLKCSSIPVSRTILSDTLGNENVIGSSKVLGSEKYYAGTAGTRNPESVVVVDNFVYFASTDFKKVYRFSPSQGIEVISDKGMGSLFASALSIDNSTENRVVGGYDPEADEFLLSVSKDIATLSVTNTSTIDQPSGSIISDSIEGFVGSTDFIDDSISDVEISNLLGIIEGFNIALDVEQGNLLGILQDIGSLGGLISQDFSGAATEGLSVDITIGGFTQTIGPFNNASSYNAALSEIQYTAFETLALAVNTNLNLYAQTDATYDTLLRNTFAATGRLEDQLQVLNALPSQIASVTDNDGTETIPIDEIFDAAGFNTALTVSEYLEQATLAKQTAGNLLALWEGASTVSVTPQDVLANLELPPVDIPLELLDSTGVDVKYLNVPDPGVPDVNFGQAIDFVGSTYQDLVALIGFLDISDAVQEVFLYIAQNIASANDVAAQLESTLQILYGDDLAPGGTGSNAGVWENYNDLLTIAYGADQTPVEENGDGLDGLEGEVRNNLTRIENLLGDVNFLFNSYAAYYIDIFGNNNPDITYTDSEGNSYSSSIFPPTLITQPYGFPAGTGLLEALQQLQAGNADAELIESLNILLQNRKRFMDEVIGDYVGVDLFGIDAALSQGELDDNGQIIEGTTPGLDDRIAVALARVAERIPPPGLLSTMVSSIYTHIFDGAPTLGNINEVISLAQDIIPGIQGPGDVNAADPYELKEAIQLQAIKDDLSLIINWADDNLATGGKGGNIFSILSLAQWLRASKFLQFNNSNVFNEIGLDPLEAFGYNLTEFSDQVAELPEGDGGNQGGLESMAQLITFLESGQLSAAQVKEIIDGYREGNKELYADIDGDGGVGSADLIDFLVYYGSPLGGDSLSANFGFNGTLLNNGADSTPPFPDE